VQDEEVELKLLSGQLASIQELSFAFKRAASRLNEMASVNYPNSLSNDSNDNNLATTMKMGGRENEP
jgi:hypothetical protein